MNSKRGKKTRNQIKRERRKTACMAITLLFAWMILLVMCVKVWAEHPAEQPISYEEHMEYIRNLGDPDALS